MLKLIRLLLGSIIAFFDVITRGPKLKRSPKAQSAVQAELSKLSLYQFKLCPFCIKVRRVMHKLNLPIETKDAKNDPEAREQLLSQGGKIKVPCLRIEENGEVKWLYESSDINRYLSTRFS
jgi:glutaredoxin